MNMRRIFLSEFMFWLIFAGIGVYSITPLRKAIHFGSDLVGGTYLTLLVHTEEAVNAKLIGNMHSIETKLKNAHKELPTEKSVKDGLLSLTFANAQQVQDAAIAIKENEPSLNQTISGSVIHLSYPEQLTNRIKADAVRSNIDVLRARLDMFGVSETPIAAQGDKNIVVELPDTADSQQAKARIGTAAKLEFRLVDKMAASKDDILYEYDGELPDDKEILPGKGAPTVYYLVNKYADINGSMLANVEHGYNQEGVTGREAIVRFTLNEEGGEKFYELTSKNVRRQLAIVLDNVVITAPNINGPIPKDSSTMISGNFTPQSSRELAALLKSGSFVAPITFDEERQIGPTLGAQARKDGLRSCLVGLGLLFIFSIAYYSLSGFFAFLALIYNMLLVLMALSWMDATLTLPGIGGMVLTIGMAIDASILIFERIKEELSKGVATKKAVSLGFSDAMVVILDANITTFIVGAVLYYFGTGPIKGFAVTMMLGVIATLISGLFFLRSLFMFVLNNFSIQKLKI